MHVFRNRASDPDLLTAISDGLNEHEPEDPSFVPSVSISYGHLIDEWKTNGELANDPKKESYLYLSQTDASNGCEYPRRCAVGPRRVVREYAMNDGQGGVRRFGVRYRDGRYDRRGHGFLGFGERIVTDLDTGAATATFYDNATLVNVGERDVYPFAGQAHRRWRWAPALPNEPKQNRVELAFADSTVDIVPTSDGRTYFTLPTKRRTRRMQGTFSSGVLETWVANVAQNENAAMLRDTTVDVLDYDPFGNVLELDVSTVDVDLTLHITRTVKNDTARWILGQVQSQTECSKTSLLPEQCRLFSRTTNEFGEVEKESTSSNENILDTKLNLVYGRDKFGNITSVTADDAFGHHRTSTAIFDGEGIFPVKHINALGHEIQDEYDPALGVLKKQIDPNKLVTEWEYDSLGRETLEKRPDGSQTKTSLTREKVDGKWRMKQRITTTGGADDETVFDGLGRPMRSFSHGPEPSGQKAPRRMQVLAYDRLSGQVAKRSVPIAEGTPDAQLLFDEYDFDALGREIRHTTPWQAVTTTTYDGLVVDLADLTQVPPRHTVTELDELGRPTTITDAAKGKTRYTYGPFDMLHTVTDPGGAVTKWTRDAFGRPRSIEDPDRGTTQLVHDGFGELLTSIDALGREITFGIDALGRIETRTDKLGAQVLTTTWEWDKAPNGIGKLRKLTSPDGIKSFTYTERGQLEGMALIVGGESFAAQRSYDEVGRLKSIDYPQPLGEEPFGIMYDYDEHGFSIGVREKQTESPFWELKEVDDAGRYQKERFGNDVETTRSYYNGKQVLESISTTLGPTNIQKLTYDWDARLHLKSRTDALQPQNKTERFQYDELDRVTCAYFGAVENSNAPCVTSYDYAPNGNLTAKSDVGALAYTDPKHPHAVTNAGGFHQYDDVGNQIKRPGGVSITYTPFDLPKTITQGAKTVLFGYDGDEQRIRKTTQAAETLYFGDIFEQVTSSAGVVERRYYVHSPERAIAVVTRGGAEPGTRYLHVDHLGSVDVITKENGTVDERRSHDAFGARRNPIWGGPSIAFTSRTTRGYTGHEEDAEFGLVNMKGRIFDPRVGRFMTTDPVIADIWNGQSLNRYAYVLNNPLAFVDPTGFFGEGVVSQPGYPDIPLPDDHIEPSEDFRAGQQVQRLLAHEIEPGGVGASAPTSDVDTTGNGGSTLPRETSKPEGFAPSPVAKFLIGAGERAVDIVPELAWGLILSNATPSSSGALAPPGSANLDGAGERVIDAVNGGNPLYAAGVEVVDGIHAYDRGDFEGLGQATVGLGVTVVMTVVTLRAGVGKGAKTTRGPPGTAAEGKVYRVDGSKTASGKPYIGRTRQSSPEARGGRDGRDRSGAQVVDKYDASDSVAGRRAEQRAINREGGVGELDNRRNEIRPGKWEVHGIDPP
ncbi:MAG: hypothetical protein IPM54_41175 [Polyangiaceae bacterium]|nr:hypothetical protein [Polyangiaceae bacterium]